MFGLNSTVGEMWHFSLLNLEYETQTMSVRGSGSWGLTRSQMWLCASPAQFTGLPWRWPVNSLASLLTTVMQFFHKARVERNVNSSTWNVISFAEIWTKIKEQIKWLSWWWSLMKSQGINMLSMLWGPWMFAPNFMAIHPKHVEIYHKEMNKNVSLILVLSEKSEHHHSQYDSSSGDHGHLYKLLLLSIQYLWLTNWSTFSPLKFCLYDG